LVDLKDTIRSFKAIMNGEGDDLPEGAFYMRVLPLLPLLFVANWYRVGDIDAARAKGEKILAELEKDS